MKNDNPKLAKRIGVLLHPTSLPNNSVCGTFGSCARDWLKLLARNGIGAWQFLPLSPPDNFGSPYSSPSGFSFNSWFLDADDLVKEGFLPDFVLNELPGSQNGHNDFVDFDLANLRSKKIGQYLRMFWYSQSPIIHSEFNQWCDSQFWLKEHTYFMQLRKKNNLLPWWEWPSEFAKYNSNNFDLLKEELDETFLEEYLIQWHLERQWQNLRKIAKDLDVILFGDLPFYVSRDSADVWSNCSLFSILEKGDLYLQSGVPPDYFSDTGQLWGSPTYRWKKHDSTKYQWWRRRISRHLGQVDLLRIDHFRALDSYWAVPGSDITAEDGFWSSSPGKKLLNRIKKDTKGMLPLVAEDLGVITPEVEYLRDHFHLPGMKILQFAFDGNPNNPYLPENIKGNNWIVYTGTHDNATTSSWWETLNNDEQCRISEKFTSTELSPCWNLIQMGMRTDACMFVAPIQDLMDLDDHARFNKPGKIDKKNWAWRLTSFGKDLEESLEKYGEMGRLFNRS